MKQWNIELSYGIGFSVTGISAENEAEAINEARKIVERGTTILLYDGTVDERGLEFECVTHIQQNRKN